jgi:hypothetical protein
MPVWREEGSLQACSSDSCESCEWLYVRIDIVNEVKGLTTASLMSIISVLKSGSQRRHWHKTTPQSNASKVTLSRQLVVLRDERTYAMNCDPKDAPRSSVIPILACPSASISMDVGLIRVSNEWDDYK